MAVDQPCQDMVACFKGDEQQLNLKENRGGREVQVSKRRCRS